MAWTQDDLDALDKAIKSGAETVKYTDREVTYRSLEEMMKIRNLMLKDLGIATGGGRVYASFSKGLNGS